MEHTLHRLVLGGIIERRADAAWVRQAMLGGHRFDLAGTLSAVDGATLTDRTQSWAANVYGRLTSDGNARPGSRLRLTSGAAAGQAWEILTSAGRVLTLAGDAEAAGAAPGDAYAIERPEEDQAVTWFASTAIRVILQHPDDHRLFPCYAILRGPASQESSPIGRLKARRGPANGPVTDELRFNWSETLTVACYALQPEEASWLANALAQLYRETARQLDRIVTEGNVSFQTGPLQQLQGEGLPKPAFMLEATLTGTRETLARLGTTWFVDTGADVQIAPGGVRKHAIGGTP